MSTRASLPASGVVDNQRSTLKFWHKIGFGFGHMQNDLCASIWFSYTLLFMQAVLLLPSVVAGSLIMLGQVFDAICTPIVGYLSDRYGTKRNWHIFGTFLICFSFPMIFSLCPWCDNSKWWPPIYFSIFILIFQWAWALVQITNLAMIPEMSITSKDRSDLNALRYSASIISNLIAYFVTWMVLQNDNDANNISPKDAFRFRDISLLLTLIGVIASVLFHVSLNFSDYKNRRLYSRLPTDDALAKTENTIGDTVTEQTIQRRRIDFLKSPLLYQNSMLYVFARLFMTTSLVYMPLWLDERAHLHEMELGRNEPFLFTRSILLKTMQSEVSHLATVPLVSFVSSFVTSLIVKSTNRYIGHQLYFFIGSLVSLIPCCWILLTPPNSISHAILYSIAILFGAGSSITMISSLCIIADMIGPHTSQGGFIYSAVTFLDKFITGIVIVVIEALKCKNRQDCPNYYCNVLSFLCGAAAILGICTLLTLRCTAGRNIQRNQVFS